MILQFCFIFLFPNVPVIKKNNQQSMSLRSLMSLLYLSPKLMWWGPYAGDLFTKSLLYLRRLLHCLPLCFLSLVYTFTPPTSKTTVVCFPCPMRSARRSAVFTCGHTSSVTLLQCAQFQIHMVRAAFLLVFYLSSVISSNISFATFIYPFLKVTGQ